MWHPTFTSHLIGIGLVTVAFLLLGRGIVRRANAKSFNPLWAFLLMLVAIAYQFFYPETSILARFGHLFLDIGVGMAIASLYLGWQRERTKMFWVPGILAVLISGSIYLVSGLLSFCANELRDDPSVVEMLVELGPDDQISEIEPTLRKYHAQAERAFPNVDLSEDEDLAQYYLVYVDSNYYEPLAIELGNDSENVDQLDRNHPVTIVKPQPSVARPAPPVDFLADDPYLAQQWFAYALDYNAVYEFLKTHRPKQKAKVAIVDTGVDSDHEDISGVYTRSGGIGDRDAHSHGTHCAGLAGAATNNGKGVGSMNWEGEFVTLSGYPALDEQGRGTDQRVAQAIIDAAEGGADVISMSLGGPALFGPPKAQADAIRYAQKQGAIVVVAAGNSNDDARRYSPANIPGVITVSAVDENLNKASFSNTNTRLKQPIAAPGVNIMSSVPQSGYQSYNGTSMATPIVSGLVGLMRAYRPELTTKEAYRILHHTGQKVRDSNKVGHVIDPKSALEAVMRLN
jgi:thermitase